MLRSMFSGVAGLRTHQTMMDVVSNNISNVNTAGYKASRTTFQESIAQLLRGSSGSAPVRAGTNPAQLGLGVNVAAIDGIFTQGATQLTNRSTDVAIQGEGFFVLNVGGERRYTRAGGFSLDQAGLLTGPTGGIVQGWLADDDENVNFNAPLENIALPAGIIIDPITTTRIEVGGNLPSDLLVGDQVTSSIVVYDSLGEEHEVTVTWEKTADNTWDLYFTYTQADGTVVNDPNAGGTPDSSVTFNPDGSLATPASGEIDITGIDFANGSDPQDVTLDLAGSVPVVQFGGSNTVEARDQDGQAIGLLRGFTIGNDGSVIGQFSNGQSKLLAYIALATFNNPGGLVREGESMFTTSGNSGVPIIGPPGDNNSGQLNAGALEASNVDLAQEFTNMIIAQRGFQSNSRSITTSDEMLQELVNLKR